MAWFGHTHQALFVSPARTQARREARQRQDTLRALLLLESLGVEGPVAYETLDLLPYLVADLHEWHLRLGRDQFGVPGGCC
ncbi:cory-CC-star protein [Spiractinospora alimapuensis]|uniref:cory-CC-star protein n=1 Tax=Spiractinospora alimapuensis TaxID=2820884 RepID=UPI003744AF01